MDFFLDYKYAYLVGNFLLFLIWLVIFLKRKDLRKEQFIVGAILSVIAPLTDYLFFYSDYWRPNYFVPIDIDGVKLGIESSIFGFIIGGISTGIYEFIMNRKALFSKPRNLSAFIVAVTNILGISLFIKMGTNSIWASVATLLLSSFYMLYIDRDLLVDMLYSSIFLTLIIIVFYVVWFVIYPEALQRFWVVDNLSGIKLWRTPIEELAWFSSAGLFIGTFYEFWRNVRKYRRV